MLIDGLSPVPERFLYSSSREERSGLGLVEVFSRHEVDLLRGWGMFCADDLVSGNLFRLSASTRRCAIRP